MNGMTLISKLNPMKRILCVCPVLQNHHPVQTRTKNETAANTRSSSSSFAGMNERAPLHLKIGYAISDPYLSCASPMAEDMCITVKETWKTTTDDNLRPTKEQQQRIWAKNEIPTNNADFHQRFDHGDVGAILVALPMCNNMRNVKQNDRKICINEYPDQTHMIKSIHESLLQYMQETTNHDLKMTNNTNARDTILYGVMNDRLTFQQAQQMALDTPHMWEDIDLVLQDMNETALCPTKMPPSLHACVALNNFLYQHVGGWPNTFG